MAISLSGIKQKQAKAQALKNLQAQAEAAGKAEGKRKTWSGIAGAGLGLLGGTFAVGAMGLTGGLAAPLVMGAASTLAKGLTDRASKGMTPQAKLKGDMYGFGAGEAKDIQKELDKSRGGSKLTAKTLAQDVALSYLTAGLGGELKAGGETLKEGGKGALKTAATTGSKDVVRKTGWKAGKDAVIDTFLGSGKSAIAEGGEDILKEGVERTGKTFTQGLGENIIDFTKDKGTELLLNESISAIRANQNNEDYEIGESLIGPVQESGLFAQGGQVPSQEDQMLALLALSELANQQETTYSGTALEEAKQPTISEIFQQRGKTLGGNNIQSLGQLLGR